MAILPRLLSGTFDRRRLAQWLCENTQVPLRVVLAPSGFGKTTALVQYAKARSDGVTYISFHGVTRADQFLGLLGEALGKEGAGYRALITELVGREPYEVIFDGIDALDPEASIYIERFASEIPAGISLIVAGTRTHIDVARYLLRGFAVLLPPETLLFTTPELRLFAASLGIDISDEYASDLRERIDGWPIVVSEVLRLAKNENIDAFEAYDRWLMQRGEAFLHILQAELALMPAQSRELFDGFMYGATPTFNQVQTLVSEGAPVIRDADSAHVMRVFGDLMPRTQVSSLEMHEPVRVRMFGRFSMRGNGADVQWIRRRDQQIIRFLLLRPQRKATKGEILAVFWPDAETSLGMQSLRTACSNIRKALTQALGRDAADAFFVVDANELRIDARDLVLDLARFQTHLQMAEQAEKRHDDTAALAHTAAAVRLHRADLFAGEPSEDWFSAAREQSLAQLEEARTRRSRLRERLRIENSLAWNDDVHHEARSAAIPKPADHR